MLVEAKIRPQDIAFLHPGQDATVKFTAYDYTIYGGLKAKLEQIGADTITDEDKKTTTTSSNCAPNAVTWGRMKNRC